MDFIPTGYITIPAAVDRFLSKNYGDDWGTQEIEFEKDATDGPVVADKLGYSRGQPLDRQAAATARQQAGEARQVLQTALTEEKLVARIEDGPPVPREYWQSPGANTTMQTGQLQLGYAAKPEDLRWQGRRVLLKTEKFDAWLDEPIQPTDTTKLRHRRDDPEKEFILRNKIETVLAVANRRWSGKKRIPGRNQMAQILAKDPSISKTRYKESPIRKILDRSYPASRRLKIPGYQYPKK